MRTKERQCFNHGSHFGCVVGVCSGTRASKMSLGADDGTKHYNYSSVRRPCDGTPFTIHNASTPVCIDGQSLEVITSFVCCGTNVGKMQISGFGLRQAEVPAQDNRHVPCEACCLVRVSVGRSDSRHEADSPFHAITKVPKILVLGGADDGHKQMHRGSPSPRSHIGGFAGTNE